MVTEHRSENTTIISQPYDILQSSWIDKTHQYEDKKAS